MRAAALAGVAALAVSLLAAGCGSSSGSKAAAPSVTLSASSTPAAPRQAVCPAAWATGWQRLANRVQAPVYCPTWMPNPLDAQIGGQFQDIYAIGKNRSYLVSFLEHGDMGSGDVHVNFRGYPGHTSIPTCKTIILEGTRTLHGTTPCFAGENGFIRVGGIDATVYTVNQDADQWHVLLAWRHNHSLYTVSQHVTGPYDSVRRVKANLKHLLGSLVLLEPQG